ncbi:hypothetical protein SAMN04490182_2429 [Pseudomonas cedrina]|uniref:DUF1993 domain-containing protein n=2 Tax=Pseudomonas cedrina TaxID=651740 RepID=A0A1V2K2R9_PSECE|nr:DUF1993 domain-containing protein [Pseudomonas cedrina]ONH51161.1 hypothetical protein BLL36_22585 [Pseudomonas cedrina subsp. cedrina]SDS80127.1 hypothetical protein SAMN04490182_2429 [Pseudomonas cedrina]
MLIYAATIPCFSQMLNTLKGLLAKGNEHASALGYDPQNLLDSRLAPDMHHLATQVRFACTQAQDAVNRLSGQPTSALETPLSMDEAFALIDTALQALAGADRELIEGRAEELIVIKLPGEITFEMTGNEYAVNWATPQFYFHLMTAYSILRHNGVPLGKADYVPHMFAYLRKG